MSLKMGRWKEGIFRFTRVCRSCNTSSLPTNCWRINKSWSVSLVWICCNSCKWIKQKAMSGKYYGRRKFVDSHHTGMALQMETSLFWKERWNRNSFIYYPDSHSRFQSPTEKMKLCQWPASYIPTSLQKLREELSQLQTVHNSDECSLDYSEGERPVSSQSTIGK